ncbi:MAG: Sec-independent protein translocase protein TatB [Gammaproteobacteria bacterium]|nr:Sec-independent protein translocase protein TatB [Gammaproteobacteria bacterium]
MFDIGFWELGLIALVALIVIGPDKLPAVARTVGKWVGRTRRFVNQVKSDIDREFQQDEIRKAFERESGLGDIKQALDNDRFGFEEEKEYLVNAISDIDNQTKKPTVNTVAESKPTESDDTVSDDRK